jgi:class 3 adenylate cyclase
VYQVWASPRNLLGLAAIPIQVGLLSSRSFDRVFRLYDETASRQENFLDLAHPARLAPGAEGRMQAIAGELHTQGHDPALVERLLHLVVQADEITASRLRPYVLADHWGASRRPVLELCLWATRLGLLDFRWDILCPLCRNPRHTSLALSGYQPDVHCDACQVDFRANFEQSVELTFRPNPAVRPIEFQEYCVGGPHTTPHILVQRLLEPGGQADLSLALEAGRYRARSLALPGGQYFHVDPQGSPELRLTAGPDGWGTAEGQVQPQARLKLENRSPEEQLFLIERLAWGDQAVTAAEVFLLQTFRDLFANEALRPGQEITVGSLAILFTDLRDSTRLYRLIGDAPAFGRVMEHFDLLRQAILAADGALVKTIGDAVMAAFPRPIAAVRAALEAQRLLAEVTRYNPELSLKAGIHYGPCIAVNLNERMDYFGTTVNLASRLDHFSQGGNVIISAEVLRDPEVAAWLKAKRVAVNPFQASLKGFDEPIPLFALKEGQAE